MALQYDLDYAAELAPHEFERFASLIDPAWIDEAFQHTGTVSLRRRRLPAERMVRLVIGLALFRNEPIWHIVQQLDLADGPMPNAPVPSAAVAGRERLDEALMAMVGVSDHHCAVSLALTDSRDLPEALGPATRAGLRLSLARAPNTFLSESR